MDFVWRMRKIEDSFLLFPEMFLVLKNLILEIVILKYWKISLLTSLIIMCDFLHSSEPAAVF